MGTNYYIASKARCHHCGEAGPERHLGKSSAGWCFSLHVYPDEGIHTLDDWRPLIASNPIRNEYGESITPDEMLATITGRSWGKQITEWQWYKENHATPGPNGLARHRVDGRHCISHGDGTWDHMIGEYS
jgi:hypothetical protein